MEKLFNMKNNRFLHSCPMPEFDFDTITLGHGSGGLLTNKLLDETIFKLFSNETLNEQHDGATFDVKGKLAYSTDSFVVSPIFFPGGNIGDLAINGTLNDLAMCGAVPKYLSLGLIIEEGLAVADLWKILDSIRLIADKHDVLVVTGDTKVVEKGKGDKIFINTSGIGFVSDKVQIGVGQIAETDVVITSGPIATHGMTIMSVREGLEFETSLQSDTAYVGNAAIGMIGKFGEKIKFLRDPTRGGVATVLNEIAQQTKLSIELEEKSIPVLTEARSACELLGLDPLYVANEGIFLSVVSEDISDEVLTFLKEKSGCSGAAKIGKVSKENPGKVILKSGIGGKRVVSMMIGDQLPRIC